MTADPSEPDNYWDWMRRQPPPLGLGANRYPVDSAGIELAEVDIADGLFERLDALEETPPHGPRDEDEQP
jgi:hypothetical protein